MSDAGSITHGDVGECAGGAFEDSFFVSLIASGDCHGGLRA